MQRYLVVANQTLADGRLAEEVRVRSSQGPCRFHIVVPETHVNHRLVWTEGEGRALALRRLEHAVEEFRELGAEVTGTIGSSNAMEAISRAMSRDDYDEIILSTLAPGISRWLRQDLPRRVAQAFPIPLTLLVARVDDLDPVQ